MKYWQRGFNLIESALVLAVAGLVIAAIWAGYRAIDVHFKTNRFISAVEVLIPKLAELYRHVDYTGTEVYTSVITLAQSAKLWPEDLQTTTGLVTPWNAPVYLNLYNPSSLGWRLDLRVDVSDQTRQYCVSTMYKAINLVKNASNTSTVISQIFVGPVSEWNNTAFWPQGSHSADYLRSFILANCPAAERIVIAYWLN